MFPRGHTNGPRRRSRYQNAPAGRERSVAARGERSERPVAGTDTAAQPDNAGRPAAGQLRLFRAKLGVHNPAAAVPLIASRERTTARCSPR